MPPIARRCVRAPLAALVSAALFGTACYTSHDTTDAGHPPSFDAGHDAGPRIDGGYDAGVSCVPEGEMVTATDGDHVFRIDTTEVTVREYDRFLRCAPGASVPAMCPPTDHRPATYDTCEDVRFDPIHEGDLPMRCISWCSAFAYCAWAAKRLCALDEFTLACRATAARVQPGREVVDPDICVLAAYADGVWSGSAADAPVPVGSAMDCRGLEPPFDRVFDLIGNVIEFVAGERADVRTAYITGGGYQSGPNLNCENPSLWTDSYVAGAPAGFRCCDD